MNKMDKQKKRALLLQVGGCLDHCRKCYYGKHPNVDMEICDMCPVYEQLSGLRKELFPNRKQDFSNKRIQAILEKGPDITKHELEYLIYVKVPNRVIADRLEMGVRELNKLIDSLGI